MLRKRIAFLELPFEVGERRLLVRVRRVLGTADMGRRALDADAPDRIIASRTRNGETDMTRPLCAFPAVPFWDGAGDPNDAQTFSCDERRR
jgi:hypothetical protein